MKQKNKPVFDFKLILRQLFLMFADILSASAASLLALLVRFDFNIVKIEAAYLQNAWDVMLYNVVGIILINLVFGLYKSIWQYAGLYELQRIVFAGVIATGVHFAEITFFKRSMPRSYWFFYLSFIIVFTVIVRFSYRLGRMIKSNFTKRIGAANASRVMIVGAGAAAEVLIRELTNSSHLNSLPVCLIDDSEQLIGKRLRGLPIVGNTEYIPDAVEKYEINSIIIAMPSVSKRRIAEIIKICSETECEVKTLPGVYQLVNSEVSVSQLRPVDVEDLLGRDPVKVSTEKITAFINGKVVLVTGGGGSIGSELCRQIADSHPKTLVIVDIYENNAYDIQQELRWLHPDLNLVVLIASVRNYDRIYSIFEDYRPDIVFHAAAHKHVPLMEVSPHEAIKNNVFGTYNVAKAADAFKAKRFVLISTDKAVNPTNIMGASKRICEMIVQAFSRKSKTNFVAVRFGNVLGSNGSVIPLFRKQIKAGGPVTVTDPNIIRYFMTIKEAVSLVLEAGAFAGTGEIFVLDMGEPVKIADLAKNLIKLSGFVPNEDIMIKYTGLRPGEKLYEERLMDEEGLKKTESDLISVARPIEMDDVKFFRDLDNLYNVAYTEDSDIRLSVADMVPTYHPADN